MAKLNKEEKLEFMRQAAQIKKMRQDMLLAQEK